MRLSDETRRIIRETTAEVFGEGAEVRLFGSRLDDAARGSDIDLLVVLEEPATATDRARKSLRLVVRLQRRPSDQHNDVLVVDPEMERASVHETALATGVPI